MNNFEPKSGKKPFISAKVLVRFFIPYLFNKEEKSNDIFALGGTCIKIEQPVP